MTPEKDINNPPSKFQRRGNRSISLVEKRKLGSQIFKDELKIKVSINTLVNETQGLPTKKYKVRVEFKRDIDASQLPTSSQT